jgi:DNA-binding MarR family transcriptional regulator
MHQREVRMGTYDVSADPIDPVLAEIGLAMFRLRRVWAKPELMRKVREQTEGSRPLQMSNLMVVYAVAGLGTDLAYSTTEAVTVGAVADRLEIDPSTASRLVGHAIDAGLVFRGRSPVDARRADLQLTDAGRRVRQVAHRFRMAYLAEITADWTEEERAQFALLLKRFTHAVTHAPALDLDGIGKIFEEAEATD